jgi:hypothetical protein
MIRLYSSRGCAWHEQATEPVSDRQSGARVTPRDNLLEPAIANMIPESPARNAALELLP